MPAIQMHKPVRCETSSLVLSDAQWLMCQSMPVSTCSGRGGMSSSDNNFAFLWLLPTTDSNTVGTQKYASSTIHMHRGVFLWEVTVTNVLTEFTQATEQTKQNKLNIRKETQTYPAIWIFTAHVLES